MITIGSESVFVGKIIENGNVQSNDYFCLISLVINVRTIEVELNWYVAHVGSLHFFYFRISQITLSATMFELVRNHNKMKYVKSVIVCVLVFLSHNKEALTGHFSIREKYQKSE